MLRESPHGYWSSPSAFVLAASAATIGLGNVWRLPTLMGQYGGSAFLLAYVLALLLVGLPLVVAELMIGRYARRDLVGTMRLLVSASGSHRLWVATGWLAVAGAALVLSYYSVIAGWSMGYIWRSAGGVFSAATPEQVNAVLVNLVGDPERSLAWHTIFMVMVVICVSHGLRKGIQPMLTRMLPVMFVLMAVVLAAGMEWGDLGAAANYLFHVSFQELGWRGIIEALHQAFFSLSLGVGVMLVFGVFLPSRNWLVASGLGIIGIDLLFSILAGLAVYSIVFAAGMQPASGVKLVFEAMPLSAGKLQYGSNILLLFYTALWVIALASAVGLMEPIVQWVMARWRVSRVFAASGAGLLIWFLGLGTLLSFFDYTASATFYDKTFFEWLELLTSRFLLPIVGVLLCIFVGRVLPQQLVMQAWADEPRWALHAWRWCLRYPARIGLIVVMLQATGLIDWAVRLFTAQGQ